MIHDIQIKRSQRAKRVRIIVTPEKIEVVAPLRMSEKKIRQFVSAKQDWIMSAQKKVQQHVENKVSFAPSCYQQGVLIPYQGKQYALNIQQSQEVVIKIDFVAEFVAYVPSQLMQRLSTTELSDALRQALMTWMASAAAQKAMLHKDKFSPLYQLHPRSMTVKTQKSRWGSCGIHDDIHLNWLLILAPVEVFEYVVVHEICHIEQRNHSADFWALVAKHCPDYKQNRAWLKKHGSSLMLGL